MIAALIMSLLIKFHIEHLIYIITMTALSYVCISAVVVSVGPVILLWHFW